MFTSKSSFTLWGQQEHGVCNSTSVISRPLGNSTGDPLASMPEKQSPVTKEIAKLKVSASRCDFERLSSVNEQGLGSEGQLHEAENLDGDNLLLLLLILWWQGESEADGCVCVFVRDACVCSAFLLASSPLSWIGLRITSTLNSLCGLQYTSQRIYWCSCLQTQQYDVMCLII